MSTTAPAASIEGMKKSSNWLIPAGLVVLAFVPSVAGALRLSEMAGAAEVFPDDRVTQAPVALIAHIVSVTVFGVLGAFQFAPSLRRGRRRWHRVAGRIVLPAGIVAALSGLWLTLFLPWTDVDSVVLTGTRVAVVTYMLMSLILGLLAVLRRDFTTHRAWMIRGYAVGMGAGTQFFTQAPVLAAAGELTAASRAATLILGWLINVLVAEWIIRRSRTSGRRRIPAESPRRAHRISTTGS
ncbi:membrane protein [Actinoplanes italicus]|uniref:Putative membrane protein DUF2306 n=1 Tax=Actinoplanes italicus TaxID=113567 RepID=A0A2T0K1U0_9ACTN|nr:DUF2306 domain-containing protein [Actinoplanes italicus]PRX16772.1 putative membrane protein DUF2306 [Actinoplanes italicus]GIE31097.1 membrane protein [Actinoplanes italicus]